MHRIIRFLIGLLGTMGAIQALGQTPVPIPVTGNLTSIIGAGQAYAGVSIQLLNCPAPVSIPAYSVIVQQGYQVQADPSGVVNTTVWPNDLIDCNGTLGNSQYQVSYVANGAVQGTPQCYQVISTQTWNLNTQGPVACNGTAPNPYGQGCSVKNLISGGCTGGTTQSQAFNNIVAPGGTLTGPLTGPQFNGNFTGGIVTSSIGYPLGGQSPVLPGSNNIVCLGDSICAGNQDGSGITFLSALIAALGGSLNSINLGVPGQIPPQIDGRIGAVPIQATVANNLIPTSGTVAVTFPPNYEIATNTNPSCSGVSTQAIPTGSLRGIDSVTSASVTVTGSLEGQCSGGSPVANSGLFTPSPYPTNPVIVTPGTPWTATNGNNLNGAVFQWMGRNITNNGNYDSTIAFNSIIAFNNKMLKAGGRPFNLTVLNGDTYGSLEWTGGADYNKMFAANGTSVNALCVSTYGPLCFDVRSYFISLACASPSACPATANLSFYPIDQLAVTHDTVPPSLHAVYAGVTLNGSINGSTDCPTIAGGTFGAAGYTVGIDSEWILITAISSSTVASACTRGLGGTTIAAHSNGAAVFSVDGQHPSGHADTLAANYMASQGFVTKQAVNGVAGAYFATAAQAAVANNPQTPGSYTGPGVAAFPSVQSQNMVPDSEFVYPDWTLNASFSVQPGAPFGGNMIQIIGTGAGFGNLQNFSSTFMIPPNASTVTVSAWLDATNVLSTSATLPTIALKSGSVAQVCHSPSGQAVTAFQGTIGQIWCNVSVPGSNMATANVTSVTTSGTVATITALNNFKSGQTIVCQSMSGGVVSLNNTVATAYTVTSGDGTTASTFTFNSSLAAVGPVSVTATCSPTVFLILDTKNSTVTSGLPMSFSHPQVEVGSVPTHYKATSQPVPTDSGSQTFDAITVNGSNGIYFDWAGTGNPQFRMYQPSSGTFRIYDSTTNPGVSILDHTNGTVTDINSAGTSRVNVNSELNTSNGGLGVYGGNCVTGAITSITLTGAVAQITAPNNCVAGNFGTFAGAQGGASTALNTGTYTVLSSGLSSSGYQVTSAAGAGGPYAQVATFSNGCATGSITSVTLSGTVATITVANTCTAGLTGTFANIQGGAATGLNTGTYTVASPTATSFQVTFGGGAGGPYTQGTSFNALLLEQLGIQNIFGAGTTFDTSASTWFKIPVAAGYTPTTNGQIGLDSTANTLNYWAAGAVQHVLVPHAGTFICTGGGTITITNANYLSTSDVIITMNTAGGTITTPPAMKTVTATTGFSVLCGATDTSTYRYDILN